MAHQNGVDAGMAKTLLPLGREFVDSDEDSSWPSTPRTPGTPDVLSTDITTLKPCVIPHHMKLPYVEVQEF